MAAIAATYGVDPSDTRHSAGGEPADAKKDGLSVSRINRALTTIDERCHRGGALLRPRRPRNHDYKTGRGFVATLDKVSVEVSVVLGRSKMPIHQLLRMGRGAVIELESGEEDEVEILANDLPVARGLVVVQGNRIAVEVRELIKRPSGLDS
jgi:flagellar motor switch protein FliN